MEREAGELLRTLETVPAARLRCKASDLRVTAGAFGERRALATFFMASNLAQDRRSEVPVILARSGGEGTLFLYS
jgi:hypothetical protein